MAKVLHEGLGIRHGLMTTIHAYTGDQRLLDAPHKDYRRARAAACNLVPTTTGAAKALGLVVPELAGQAARLRGARARCRRDRSSTSRSRSSTRRRWRRSTRSSPRRADRGELEGILAYSEEPLVSSDIVRSPYSSVFDAGLTAVVDGTQVKVVAWYDNEWGYSNRLVDLAQRVVVPVTRLNRAERSGTTRSTALVHEGVAASARAVDGDDRAETRRRGRPRRRRASSRMLRPAPVRTQSAAGGEHRIGRRFRPEPLGARRVSVDDRGGERLEARALEDRPAC